MLVVLIMLALLALVAIVILGIGMSAVATSTVVIARALPGGQKSDADGTIFRIGALIAGSGAALGAVGAFLRHRRRHGPAGARALDDLAIPLVCLVVISVAVGVGFIAASALPVNF